MSDFNYLDMVRLCSKVAWEIADGREKKMGVPIRGRGMNEEITESAWEMFELITSVYFGKQYYFVEDNGLVYSRETHKHMTKDDAINEFLNIIWE